MLRAANESERICTIASQHQLRNLPCTVGAPLWHVDAWRPCTWEQYLPIWASLNLECCVRGWCFQEAQLPPFAIMWEKRALLPEM